MSDSRSIKKVESPFRLFSSCLSQKQTESVWINFTLSFVIFYITVFLQFLDKSTLGYLSKCLAGLANLVGPATNNCGPKSSCWSLSVFLIYGGVPSKQTSATFFGSEGQRMLEIRPAAHKRKGENYFIIVFLDSQIYIFCLLTAILRWVFHCQLKIDSEGKGM